MDFHKDESHTFFGSKVEEVPQGFIDELFIILNAIGVSSQEKEELASYQLNDIDQVCFD